MAKSREEMQDIALYHMEKLNRRTKGDRDNTPQSLEEQFKELTRVNNLTPEQRMKEKSWEEWSYDLRRWMESRETARRYTTFTTRFTGWVFQARKTELQKFHSEGTAYKDMADWLQDMQMVHMNL